MVLLRAYIDGHKFQNSETKQLVLMSLVAKKIGDSHKM